MKINNARALIGTLICFIALASAINLVGAVTQPIAGSLWTTSDALGQVHTAVFDVGDTVYIWWSTTPSVPVEIEIYDSWGSQVANLGSYTSPPPPAATWTPTAEGVYAIVIPGSTIIGYIAAGSILVVPESVLGTVMATVAGFAAFGAIGLVKHNRARGMRHFPMQHQESRHSTTLQ